MVPGRPQRFASAMAFAGSALGVVVESHEGRPTKIEGNPLHPDSLGGAHTFAQASVLELYDPDRSRGPRQGGQERSWNEAAAMLAAQAARLGDGKGLAIVTEAHRSPTLAAQLAALRGRFPAARIVRYEPFAPLSSRQGAELAFGRPLDAVYAVERARVILTLDCDLLQSVKHARGFADGRRQPGETMNRLYAVESAFSITGAAADHRLRVRSRPCPRDRAGAGARRRHPRSAGRAVALGSGVALGERAGQRSDPWRRARGRRRAAAAGSARAGAPHQRALAAPVRWVAPFSSDQRARRRWSSSPLR